MDRFVCFGCGEMFGTSRPDEEAVKEAEKYWGDNCMMREQMVILCDDCYQQFMKYRKEKLVN